MNSNSVLGQEAFIGSSTLAVILDDVSVESSTDLVQVSGLTVPVEANARYIVRLFVLFGLAGTSSGCKFAMGAPTLSLTSLLHKVFNSVANTIVDIAHVSSLSGVAAALASVGTHNWTVDGVIEVGADGGILYPKFAQNASSSLAITIKRGSYLQITKVG